MLSLPTLWAWFKILLPETCVCVKCSQQHLTAASKSVLGNSAEQNAATREQIKCANCGGNHTASYKGCSSRKAYLQQQVRTKAKVRPLIKQHQPITRIGNIVNVLRALHVRLFNHQRTQLQAKEGVFTRKLFETAHKHQIQRSSEISSALFTISECMGLARDLLFHVKRCKSKENQFLALSELMIHYVYNGK